MENQETVSGKADGDDFPNTPIFVLVGILVVLGIMLMTFTNNSPDGSFRMGTRDDDVEQVSLSIQKAVNAHIDANDDLDGPEKVSLVEDAEWAKYQDRIRDETRQTGKAKSYYDIKVGEKKIGELEAPRVSTINVRGTVDHYTIEIYSAYSGKYSDFDDRHIYDSAKDNSK